MTKPFPWSLSFMLPVIAGLAACAHPDASGPAAPGTAGAVQCPVDGEARLDSQLHDYILAHGDVVLQALQENQKRQRAAAAEAAKQMLATNRAAIFDGGDPVTGNPQGDVTVAEWFDYECPFCKKAAPDLERLIAADPGVKIVYKDFPILGPASLVAAKASLAAMRQGKYAALHNALMADRTPEHQLTERRIFEIARATGLDMRRLKADMATPEIEAKIAANKALAARLGISGTPGLVIGDKLLPGAVPYDMLTQAVAETRRRVAAN